MTCAWGASGTDVFLFGGSGLVMHGSAAAGFNKTLSPTGDPFKFGRGTPGAVDVWIRDQILELTDHGVSWKSAGPTPALDGVGGDAAGTGVWAVAVNGTILHRP